jgi:hypothetical protein
MKFPRDWFDRRKSVGDVFEIAAIQEEITEYEEQSKQYRKKNKWSMFSMLYIHFLCNVNPLDGLIKFGGSLSSRSIFPESSLSFTNLQPSQQPCPPTSRSQT